MEQPQYQHDCNDCTFLGQFQHNGTKYDLYHHDDKFPTIIARYGNEGSQYASGMIFGKEGQLPELKEAYKRANERGLNCTI